MRISRPDPVTASLKVIVQATELALVGEVPALVIEVTVGAVVSNTYVAPFRLVVVSVLPAGSLIPEALIRLRPIVEFEAPVPVTPVVATGTVQVACGAEPPFGVGVPTVGVPVTPAPFCATKFDAATPLTGSLKVTVKRSGFALLGLASVRVIELAWRCRVDRPGVRRRATRLATRHSRDLERVRALRQRAERHRAARRPRTGLRNPRPACTRKSRPSGCRCS